MLKCKQVKANLARYVTGELEAWMSGAIEAHVACCEGCRAELYREQQISAVLSQPLTTFDPPYVLDHVIAQSCVPEKRFVPARLAWAGVVAAVAVCVLALAMYLPHQLRLQPPPLPYEVRAEHPAPPTPVPVVRVPEKPTPRPVIRVVHSVMPPRKRPIVAHKKPVRTVAPPLVRKPDREGYLVVCVTPPEVADAYAESPETAADAAVPGPVPGPVEESSYTIKMTDKATGEVTSLSVTNGVDGSGAPESSVEFDVLPLPASDEPAGRERSLRHEDIPDTGFDSLDTVFG